MDKAQLVRAVIAAADPPPAPYAPAPVAPAVAVAAVPVASAPAVDHAALWSKVIGKVNARIRATRAHGMG